jgi:PEGA domain
MMKSLLRFLAALVLATICAGAGTAFAQQDPSPAAEVKKRGDLAMDAFRYADALLLYSEAYGATRDPGLLYNMGRAYEALAQYPNALEKLEQFQQQAPADLRAKVPGLAQRIADVRAHVTTVTITSNVVGARVLLGRVLIGTTPLAKPIATNAGPTTLEVDAEGYHPIRRELTLKGGESVSVDASLASKSTSGVIVVQSPNVGAEVAVDGVRAGSVPVELIVKAGSHALLVRKEGYETSQTAAVVAVGERKVVDIPLEATRSIATRWWFWTGVAVVVAAGAVVTYALLTDRKADSGTIAPGQVSGPLLRW